MLICRNAEGVHGKKKVGNPCSTASLERIFSLVNPAQVTSAQFGQTVLLLKLKIS